MAALPENERTTVRSIYEALEAAERGKRRGHLGASMLGRECSRELWYGFRFCGDGGFNGHRATFHRHEIHGGPALPISRTGCWSRSSQRAR